MVLYGFHTHLAIAKKVHELSLCQQIIKQLSDYAKANRLHKVTAVTLLIGELSGVDIEAMTFSFPIAAKSSIAENSTLLIDIEKGQAYCHSCDKPFALNHILSPCSHCGGYQYDIKQGKIMQLKSMEGH